MINVKDILCAEQEPWVDLQKFKSLCDDHGITITKGARDNYTDGEVHYILNHNGEEYVVHSNYWDYNMLAWRFAIEWILERC